MARVTFTAQSYFTRLPQMFFHLIQNVLEALEFLFNSLSLASRVVVHKRDRDLKKCLRALA